MFSIIRISMCTIKCCATEEQKQLVEEIFTTRHCNDVTEKHMDALQNVAVAPAVINIWRRPTTDTSNTPI